ncbi:MAG TPA: undecaprenyl-diphosphatase UppP [bacterium]|jgi:undecaprenyl-diphosphatase
MSILQAIVLGIIQGLTEFLPISSTAHLRIIPALVGWSDPGAAFTAVIQFGTLLAVFFYFRGDIARMITGVVGGLAAGKPLRDRDAQLGWMIVLGTIPVVILGVLFKKSIESEWRSLYVIAGSMIVLALALMAAEIIARWRVAHARELKRMDTLSWKDVLFTGLAQAVALVPGSSRSGTTITGGLLVGMNRETAARFSFLLSLPSVLAAGLFELIKQRHMLLSTEAGVTGLIVATVVSGVVGYASIAFLLNYLRKRSTYLFIVYRLALGCLLLALLMNGVLPPD